MEKINIVGWDVFVPDSCVTSSELPHIITEIYDMKIYDHEDCEVLPGDVVLDVGANVGVFARYAIEEKGASKVICIEPNPTTIEVLVANMELWGLTDKVIFIHSGAWSSSELLFIQHPINGWLGVAYVSEITKPSPNDQIEWESVPINVDKIDNLLDGVFDEKIDFVKMDIEGSEREAIKGMERLIKKYKPKMSLSVYHLEDDKEVIKKMVKEMNPEYEQLIVEFTQWAKILYCNE